MASSNGNIFRVTGPLWGTSPPKGQWRNFDVFFDLRPNKQLGKQSRRRWFETPLRSIWRHCNSGCVFTRPRSMFDISNNLEAMEVFKCFHGMDPMYLNNLFCKQEIKYDLRDKTLSEQPKFSTKTYGYRSFKYYGSKLWNALPFEIKNRENYDEFKLRLTTWCHSSDLDKLEIFWLFFFLVFFGLNCHCYPNWQGSRGQHGAHLGSVGPS